MTAILLAAVLAGAPAAASPSAGPRPAIRVTVTDVGGAADVGLADALARTLAEAGLTASPAHRLSGDCGDECVHVSVRKLQERLDERGFLIEVRAHGEVARSPVRLAPTASSFDQVHALAIEAELLTARMRPPRRKRAPRTVIAAAQPAGGTLPSLSPPEEAATDSDEGLLPLSPELQSASADRPTTPGAAATLREQAQPPVAPTDERLALSVAGMVLADTGGDLLMHGTTLGLRLRITHRLDVSASVSGVDAQKIVHRGSAYQLDMLPLTLAAAVAVPGVPALRVGGGVEGLLVGGERDGREPPMYWSIGPLARLEHRYPIRTFALMSSLQVALHPESWNTAGHGGPLVAVPPWTIGVSLGLEFRLW